LYGAIYLNTGIELMGFILKLRKFKFEFSKVKYILMHLGKSTFNFFIGQSKNYEKLRGL
jgi:hypothetical protein